MNVQFELGLFRGAVVWGLGLDGAVPSPGAQLALRPDSSRARRAGWVQGGVAAERSEGTLDAHEHRAALRWAHGRWAAGLLRILILLNSAAVRESPSFHSCSIKSGTCWLAGSGTGRPREIGTSHWVSFQMKAPWRRDETKAVFGGADHRGAESGRVGGERPRSLPDLADFFGPRIPRKWPGPIP